MAGGFRLKKSNYENFKKDLLSIAKKHFKENEYIPTLEIDTVAFKDDLNLGTIEKINKFAPFGMGNKRPIFILENVEIVEQRQIGKNKEHLKCIAKLEDKFFEIVGFDMQKYSEQIKSASKFVIELNKNVWNNIEKIECHMIDFE